jgi:hypothetical protein
VRIEKPEKLHIPGLPMEELQKELAQLNNSKKDLLKQITLLEDRMIEIKEELLRRKKTNWDEEDDR